MRRKCAEIHGGLMEGEAADGRPEVQGIAVGVAGEAVIDLPVKMDGEAGRKRRGSRGSDTGREAGDLAARSARKPIRSRTSVMVISCRSWR